jgi:hypothetical protein
MRCHGSFKATTKRRIGLMLTVALAVESVSCGTLIHPERCGQPRTGVLDPSIIMLDGLGVLVFVVPGVVAFIVDFSTGAVYLPEQRFNPNVPPPGAYPLPPGAPPQTMYVPPRSSLPAGGSLSTAAAAPLTRINAETTTLTKEKIEAIVRAQTGQAINLDAPDVRVIRANNMDDASDALENPDRSATR